MSSKLDIEKRIEPLDLCLRVYNAGSENGINEGRVILPSVNLSGTITRYKNVFSPLLLIR